MNQFMPNELKREVAYFINEDGWSRNPRYALSLPSDPVSAKLFIKSDTVLSGLPWFYEVFNQLGHSISFPYHDWEGKGFVKGDEIELGEIPFSLALSGERVALNLLQHASSISTWAARFVEKAKKYNIAVLDTRKTLPGLRSLEKYAVSQGGACNHRFDQNDVWMIKDNHKSFFGGLEKAVEYFKGLSAFYTPMVVEIHDFEEYQQAVELGIRHLMLDNFSPEMVKEAINIKPEGITIEVSGGINLESIEKYLIPGVDAISIGSLTYAAPPVDISFKYQR